MAGSTWREAFEHALEVALEHLYDPAVLRQSKLMALFSLERHPDATLALQRLLNESIAALKPAAKVPAQSGAWRVHRVLTYRFTEQLTQHETASDLGLSVRQLRRVEKSAIKVLADALYLRFHLADQERLAASVSESVERKEKKETVTPSYQQELDWLVNTVQVESVPTSQLLASVLQTARPLLSARNLVTENDVPPDTPSLLVKPAIMRQALLDIVALATRCGPDGVMRLCVRDRPKDGRAQVDIDLRADAPGLTAPSDEELDLVHRLLAAAGADLETEAVSGASRLCFKITAPVAERTTVLVIDDNKDTVRLMQRYLADTRYRFVGMTDPGKVSCLDAGITPAVIVLDVMMPDLDGWDVLAQLRTSPATCDVPVIVCTILPQESMALALGASGFVRKPVSRDDFLRALDQQLGP